MFPVTVGLGESMAGALNAPAPVPATGGGWCLCTRGLSIRLSHFRIRRLLFSQAYVDSHDLISVFEAMVDIELLMITRVSGGVKLGTRLMYGSFCYERRLGYPLLTPSTVAPESLLERLRSSRGSSVGRVSVGSRERPPRG